MSSENENLFLDPNNGLVVYCGRVCDVLHVWVYVLFVCDLRGQGFFFLGLGPRGSEIERIFSFWGIFHCQSALNLDTQPAHRDERFDGFYGHVPSSGVDL